MDKVNKIMLLAYELEKNTKNIYFKNILNVLIEYEENLVFCITSGIISSHLEIYKLFYIIIFIIKDGFDVNTFGISENPAEGIYEFISYEKSKSFIIYYVNQKNINVFASIDNELIQCKNIIQAVNLDNSFEIL